MKEWLIQFGVKAGLDKAGPSAIRGAILGAVGWLAMKNNIIPGIHTDAATNVTMIYWDQVQAWAIAGIPAVAGFAIKFLQHNGTTAAKAIANTQEGVIK